MSELRGTGGAVGVSSISSSSASAASCCATWALNLKANSPQFATDFSSIVGFPSFESTSTVNLSTVLAWPCVKFACNTCVSAVIAPSLLCFNSSIRVSLYLSMILKKANYSPQSLREVRLVAPLRPCRYQTSCATILNGSVK